ncbi:MAG: nitroreductase family protein [Candidatus Tritonobacter lacicola]|nr:nitroreductase family protein [Candidatus Tritonobacter lacicola]
MALIDLIRKRASIRKYSSKPVERETVLKCIEAARLAPSACNVQPWEFIVVEGETKAALCLVAFSTVHAFNRFAETAPVIIVVAANPGFSKAKLFSYFKDTKYHLIDIGIACEHLVLQATELGLGTCWIGWFHEEKVKALLGVPKGKRIVAMISLGYYEEGKERTKKRKALDEIVSFNTYGQ